MNIMRNDKVVLIKEMGNINMVGNIYEVANVTETAVVIRDATSKIAVGAIAIDAFENYFKKPEEVRSWTKWRGMVDKNNNLMAFYRTNGKKVQVRTPDGIRTEASCNKCDEFNLSFGLNLAYARCIDKCLKSVAEEYESTLKRIYSDMTENKNMMKKLIRTLDEEV